MLSDTICRSSHLCCESLHNVHYTCHVPTPSGPVRRHCYEHLHLWNLAEPDPQIHEWLRDVPWRRSVFTKNQGTTSHQKPLRPNQALTDVVAENVDQLGNLTALGVDVAHICEDLKKRAQAVAAPAPRPNWTDQFRLERKQDQIISDTQGKKSPSAELVSDIVAKQGNRELAVRAGSAPARHQHRSAQT